MTLRCHAALLFSLAGGSVAVAADPPEKLAPYFRPPKELAGDLKMEKIDFHGSPAIWQGALGQMAVFKSGVMATLNADPAPGKDKRQTIEVLMTRIAGRL